MSYRWFADSELLCKCGHCTSKIMDPEFMRKIIQMRELSPFPFMVSSAYRCPRHNNNVSSSGMHGAHTTGRAMDIRTHNSIQREWLLRHAICFGFTRIGIGRDFIHLDNLTKDDGFDENVVWHYYPKRNR